MINEEISFVGLGEHVQVKALLSWIGLGWVGVNGT